MLVVLFSLNLADALLTLYALGHGAVELNPLLNSQSLIGKIIASVIFAVAWLPTYIYCDKHAYQKPKTILKMLLTILLTTYTFVVLNNLLQLMFPIHLLIVDTFPH